MTFTLELRHLDQYETEAYKEIGRVMKIIFEEVTTADAYLFILEGFVQGAISTNDPTKIYLTPRALDMISRALDMILGDE